MRWIKHMVATRRDEKIARLIASHGMEGFGFYWAIVEIVAEAMGTGDDCSATYPLTHWSHLLYSHHNKVRKVLGNLGVIGLVTVEWAGKDVRVIIPNILKYRDEYSRKSAHSPDNVGSKQQSTEAKLQTEAAAEQFPAAAARIRFFHPATDESMICRLIDLIRARMPDANDARLTDILHHSHQGKRQRGAALWLNTLPEYLTTLLCSAQEAPAAVPGPDTPKRTPEEEIYWLKDSLSLEGVPQTIRDGWQRELDLLDATPKKPPNRQTNISVIPLRESIQ